MVSKLQNQSIFRLVLLMIPKPASARLFFQFASAKRAHGRVESRAAHDSVQATRLPSFVSLGVSVGLDRAHNSIFYNYNSVPALGLLDNNRVPRPLYRAYELMAKLISTSTQQLPVQGAADGRLDAGMGAVLVSRDTVSGTVRALLVNRNSNARTVRITLNGSAETPVTLHVFDQSDDRGNREHSDEVTERRGRARFADSSTRIRSLHSLVARLPSAQTFGFSADASGNRSW